MKQMHSSAELKAIAREKLIGKYGICVAIFFLYYAINMGFLLLYSFSGLIYYKNEMVSQIFSILLSIILTILLVGIWSFFLNIARNQDYNIGDLFWGFTHHLPKYILCNLLILLMLAICVAPAVILFLLYFQFEDILFMLAGTILAVIGLFFLFYLGLGISPVIFLFIEKTDASIPELFQESFQLMKGNRFRLFYFNVSFIGWFFLGLLSCCIGFLWIFPYIYESQVTFYLDLLGELPDFNAKENESPEEPVFDFYQ